MSLEVAEQLLVLLTEQAPEHDFVDRSALEISLDCHDFVVALEVLVRLQTTVFEYDEGVRTLAPVIWFDLELWPSLLHYFARDVQTDFEQLIEMV